MGRILVIESDSVFAALVEDRLREAGHEVELCEDEDQALAAASRSWAEVVVLDLGLSLAAGGGLVRAIRELNQGRSLRVLALSNPLTPERRLEVLRAGADEVLERPVHLEELVLRVDRLSSSGTGDPVELEGSLASYPLWELLQPLVESRGRGRLMIWGRRGSGSLTIGAGGRLADATWESLKGAEALLALLGMEEGNFRFVASGGDAGPSTGAAEGRPVLELQRALLEAAWMKDELDKRAEFMPGTGEPLADSGFTLLPARDPDLPELPVEEVLERVRSRPGIRLFDLLAENLAAPLRMRLTVAWLREKGVLVARGQKAAADSTLEIARHEVLDAALDDLLRVVRGRGVEARPVPILFLAEPPAWPILGALLAELEESWRPEELGPLLELVRDDIGGSAVLQADGGEVSLHVQVLDATSEARLAAVVSVCAGAVVWLGPEGGSSAFREVLERFEATEHGVGFAVAGGSESAAAASETIAPYRRWRVVPEPPRNLLAVFRMIRSRGGHDRPAAR